MTEPRIQYAKTEDGVSIAYWMLGEGVPIIHTPMPAFSHIELEWRTPEWREWYERILQGSRLIRYDHRGAGLSQREGVDYSLETFTLDLEAVVDDLGLESFVLLGALYTGPVAIAYAARHPERVSHFILWCSWARAADFYKNPQIQALAAMRDQDWETYTLAMAHALMGWPSSEKARRVGILIQQSISQEELQRFAPEATQFDAASLLAQVNCPTLVLHPRGFYDVSLARDLASSIPGARLAVVEGDSMFPSPEGEEAIAVDEFLGVKTEEPAEDTQPSLPSGTAIILFLDIADSTALTTKLGDAAYREKERELDTSLRAAITGAGGTPVEGKLLGDGVMAVFTSARSAIDAAQRCRDLGNEAGLPLHIGVHAGDVVREGNNVHGGAVQVASRVQNAAAPGEILVSATVRDLARTSAGVEFEDRGEHELKGIAEPQRLFAVREPD